MLTEGLLIYLTPEEVAALARDLAAPASFQRWIFDIASPGLLRMMQKQMGDKLEAAQAPFKFAPAEGPPFFEQHGWRVLEAFSEGTVLGHRSSVPRLGGSEDRGPMTEDRGQ